MCETCEFCGKSLVAIHSSRKNGKLGKDWDSRRFHKKCWKENILQYNSEDKIYFLLMIIYQSIGEKNKSIK